MEHQLILYSAVAGLHATTVASLYSLGGRSGKWLRRFVAPAWLMTGVAMSLYFAGKWGTDSLWFLLSYPLYAAVWSVGYGVNSQLTRWLKNKYIVRAVTGMAYALAALPIAFVSGHGAVSLLLIFAAASALVVAYLGAKNPLPAAVEEFLVCWYSLGFALFLPFVS